ncbi:serine hydrolase domain-containing protein [Flagellimonas pacifica]|uniref:CubicO group peptidase, beta-lactamase class C family n=1 Tax=Flagellimonas pacifica TaxID=1247520 RepID=A0A285MRX3_9FLAO|nr:serine hydrolase [Allomuricauda parva]SNY99934.1 CubicO group peptidase, beta-lactamase class C family [Allomuricauda parva]
MRLSILTLLLVINFNGVYSQNINGSVLDEIKLQAKETHSDAVIIIKDGKIVYEDYFEKKEKPIYIASAGKSLVSLAIGKLMDHKLIDSLDQPVYSFFPEWKQGKKQQVTIRMLLNHTSGLQNYPNASIELEPAPTYKVKNVVKLALAAELSSVPGKKFDYNNKAVALLGGIVEKTSGKRFDYFFIDEFYKAMNIANYGWVQDESGNPTAHGAFVIKPSDFIKFGELILNKGMYNNKRLISESWIEESFKQGQEFDPRFGLLWWRYLKNNTEDVEVYYADGYRGNYLVIIPNKGIVAVRCADHENFNYPADFFTDFVKLITKL